MCDEGWAATCSCTLKGFSSARSSLRWRNRLVRRPFSQIAGKSAPILSGTRPFGISRVSVVRRFALRGGSPHTIALHRRWLGSNAVSVA